MWNKLKAPWNMLIDNWKYFCFHQTGQMFDWTGHCLRMPENPWLTLELSFIAGKFVIERKMWPLTSNAFIGSSLCRHLLQGWSWQWQVCNYFAFCQDFSSFGYLLFTFFVRQKVVLLGSFEASLSPGFLDTLKKPIYYCRKLLNIFCYIHDIICVLYHLRIYPTALNCFVH